MAKRIDPADSGASLRAAGMTQGDVVARVRRSLYDPVKKSLPRAPAAEVETLARGMTQFATSGISVPKGMKNKVNEFFGATKGQLTGFTDTTWKAASKEIDGVLNDVGKKLGVDPGVAGQFFGLAQQVLSGQPDVGSMVQSVLGIAGVAAGPVGMLAAPLISMGLGALFGKDKASPPTPPKVRKIESHRPEYVTLTKVFEELLHAHFRWHKAQIIGRSGLLRATDFALSYTDAARERGYVGSMLTSQILPSAYSAAWRLHPGPLLREGAGGTPTPASGSAIGAPLAWKVPNAPDEYRYWHDALGEFVGFQQHLSGTVSKALEKAFEAGERDKRFAAFQPYFATMGVVEWILSSAMVALGAAPTSSTLILSNFSSQPGVIAKALLAPYEAMTQSQGKGNVNLAALALNPLGGGLAALAQITLECRLALAAYPKMAASGDAAKAKLEAESKDLRGWLDQKLNWVVDTLSGKIEEQGEETRTAITSTIINTALIAGGGLTTLLGIGLVALGGRK